MMTGQELIDERRGRFRVAGNPIRTIEDAREFLHDVGFCLMYPLRYPFIAPIATFVGAYAGTGDGLPYAQLAFADPRARAATELMVRMLREKSAFESNVFEESPLLISAELFPYVYALLGDKMPTAAPKVTGPKKVTPLALDVYSALEQHGAATKSQLQSVYLENGESLSQSALDRALNELWSRLKTTRVDYSAARGASWDLLAKWAPEAVRRGSFMAAPEAISALVSRYMEATVAVDEKEIVEVLGRFAPRSRVSETVRALVGAQEIVAVAFADGRTLLQIAKQAPPRAEKATAKPVKRRNKRRTHA